MSAWRLTSSMALTAAEWHILEPLLPPENVGGRPRQYPLREVRNGLQDVLRAGCAWRLLPHDLPHGQTASQTVRAGRRDGTWVRIHAQRRARVRTQMDRHPQPSAALIDAPTVKPTDKGGRMALLAPPNSTAASAISSVRRRVSSCGSSSIPPV
jgi:putative transposase